MHARLAILIILLDLIFTTFSVRKREGTRSIRFRNVLIRVKGKINHALCNHLFVPVKIITARQRHGGQPCSSITDDERAHRDYRSSIDSTLPQSPLYICSLPTYKIYYRQVGAQCTRGTRICNGNFAEIARAPLFKGIRRVNRHDKRAFTDFTRVNTVIEIGC